MTHKRTLPGIGSFCLLFAAVGLTAVPCSAEETLESVEKKITEQWAKIKSLTAETKLETLRIRSDGRSAQDNRGQYAHLKADGKELFRHEVKTKLISTQGNMAEKIEESIVMCGDGKWLYSLAERDGQRQATKRDQLSSGIGIGGKAYLEYLHKNTVLTLGGDATVDGREVWVLEATPKGIGAKAVRSKYYVSKELGMLLKRETLNISGSEPKPQTTYTVTNIKTDAELEPEKFVFQLPPGVELVDRTSTE